MGVSGYLAIGHGIYTVTQKECTGICEERKSIADLQSNGLLADRGRDRNAITYRGFRCADTGDGDTWPIISLKEGRQQNENSEDQFVH
jgi:hypothetical protein